MILAVSIGNTNIRAAIGTSNELKSQTVFYANNCSIIEQIEASFGPIWGQVEGSILASVVPQKTDIIVTALANKTGYPVTRVNIKKCGSLNTNAYEGLLGEDRAVCCYSALQKFAPPFVVVDFGTATTINVVNTNGELIGGAILPGLLTGILALSKNTAQLPSIKDIPKDVPLIGKNTHENLISGAVNGLSFAVEGFVNKITNQYNLNKPKVIATGGHAPVVLPYCQFEYNHEPSLLLEGLLSLGAK